MDNASPSPPKRPRTIDFLTSQLGKPVRYFPFNRKTGNIIRNDKSSRIEHIQTVKSQNVSSSTLPAIPFPSTMKFVPNKEANISNKLQKLKLKSPDGRDLGEINVKLLPQKGDGIGGKTIMLQKHSLFGKIDNPSTVSILKPVEKTKQVMLNAPVSIVQTTGTQSSFVINESNCISVNTIHTVNTVRETGTNRPIVNVKQRNDKQHLPRILRHPESGKYSSSTQLGSKIFFINVDKQSGLNTVKSVNNDTRNLTSSNQKIIVVHAENYPDSTEGKKNNSLGIGNEMRIPSSSKDDNELASSTSNVRTIPSVFWNPTKFSEITTKLNNQKSRGNDNEIVKIGGNLLGDKSMMLVPQSLDSEHIKIASRSNIQGSDNNLHRKQKPKLNSWTIVKTSGKKYGNSSRNSCESDGTESPKSNSDVSRISQSQNIIVHNLNNDNTQNVTSTTSNIIHSIDSKQCDESIVTKAQHIDLEDKTNNDQNLRENIMVIVHGDMDTLKQNEKSNTEKNDETMSMEINADTIINANVIMEDGNIVEMNDKVLNSRKSDESSKRDMISTLTDSLLSKQKDFDIIEKALSSCKDQDLRNKALKALADCGIGVKRNVPVPPKMSVRDTGTQTDIFSLFESEMLLEYSDESPNLNRLNVIKRNEKPPNSHFHLSQSLSEQQLMNNTNFPDLSFNIPSPANSYQHILEELFADDLLSDDSKKEVNQVKDILTKSNPIIEQAYSQLQKDLQAATTPDADGLMGIHRAVISGSISNVQRQLIVLKAVKESIELPTADGKTSLELAVSLGVDPRIVRALLSAGAKPAVPIKLHESALIIASRTASGLLPELVKYVTPSSLLDLMDSEGFAPLHYCAQQRNMEGLKCLVSAGASVNLKDAKSGRTALFHSLESRNIEMALYLVENGASPTINNFAGQSPAALVDEYRHNSLIEKFNQTVR